MAKIYLVRHAESIANTQGIYQGQTYNTDLSPLGKQQALALRERLRNVHFNKVIASPLLRTVQTASKVAYAHNLRLELDVGLLETNHGAWEGLCKSDIARLWPKLYKKWLAYPAGVSFPHGEDFAQTQVRVLEWWNSVSNCGEDILVVTHDNIARIIIARVLGLNLDLIWQFHLYPAAISIIETSGGVSKLLCLNDAGHLAGIQADLAIHAL